MMQRHVPLSIKVMTSYLLVVGLAVAPVFFYIRKNLPTELHYLIGRELGRELDILVDRLSAVPPAELPAAAALLAKTVPQRVTVLAPDGTVIDDSLLHAPGAPDAPMENHADRPEVMQALAEGHAMSTRSSSTTQDVFVYAAARFQRAGVPRGVLRLAVKVEDAERAGARFNTFLRHAGAAALSTAVILSLVAALVVSRPLRRIVAAARAFAAGDFGHPIEVHSNDELGEVAQALTDLAAQLRGRLAEAGANHMALRVLIDELPVGIILYTSDGSPTVMNGCARSLCKLTPANELERARHLMARPPHADIFERVLRTRIPEAGSLELPWEPGRPLHARWIGIAAPSGDTHVALIVFPQAPFEAEDDPARDALRGAVKALHRAVRALAPAPLAAECAAAAQQAEVWARAPLPQPEDVEVVELAVLCARGVELASAGGEAHAVELVLREPRTPVIEAAGRSVFAISQLIASAAMSAGRPVKIQDDVLPTGVRLSVRARPQAWQPDAICEALSCLGGSAGTVLEGGETEAWLVVPRA